MRIVRFLLVSALIFFMTSCTQVIKNSADEIRLSSWRAELKGGGAVEFSFNEDDAEFIILNSKNKTVSEIKGKAFFDKTRLTVFDEKDTQSYVFNYKLKDNKLKLFYAGGEITLKRGKIQS